MIKRKFVERLKEHCSDIKQKTSTAESGFYLTNYNWHNDFKSAGFFFFFQIMLYVKIYLIRE